MFFYYKVLNYFLHLRLVLPERQIPFLLVPAIYPTPEQRKQFYRNICSIYSLSGFRGSKFKNIVYSHKLIAL